MKIFLVIMLAALQLNAQTSVDNSAGDVDKEDYQHQLICKATAKNQEYHLGIKWKTSIDESFSYHLTNLTSGEAWSHNYRNSVYTLVFINDSVDQLKLFGRMSTPTIIGERLKISEVSFEKDNDIFALNNVKITNLDLNDYCKIPVSKLCGRDSQVEKIDLEFENSTCEYKSLE